MDYRLDKVSIKNEIVNESLWKHIFFKIFFKNKLNSLEKLRFLKKKFNSKTKQTKQTKFQKMIYNEKLRSILCSKSNDTHHFVKEPIVLDCKHSICKKCLLRTNIFNLECNKCEKKIYRDMSNDSESIEVKELINKSLGSLFEELEKQTSQSLEKFNSI